MNGAVLSSPKWNPSVLNAGSKCPKWLGRSAIALVVIIQAFIASEAPAIGREIICPAPPSDNGLPPLFPLVLLIIGAGSFCFFYWLGGKIPR